MMNLVNYTAMRHSSIEARILGLPKEQSELATKINTYITEAKPLHRQDILDYFGITKHMFYKLKKLKAIEIPAYMTNKLIRTPRKESM